MLERVIQYTQKLNQNEHLLEKNKKLQEAIVKEAMRFYEIGEKELNQHVKEMVKEGRGVDKVSVGQALKHVVRDWSAEGEGEREDAFPCVISMLLAHSEENSTHPARVLLPGSGLGRLGHDIQALGGTHTSTFTLHARYVNRKEKTPISNINQASKSPSTNTPST